MADAKLSPAAQYLRMSTEHQQYSLENQKAAIKAYADDHALVIVQTYTDCGKSGVVLRHRPGLQQLLEDVVRGATTFKAILVYDVSRWGRFQDTDESAHYEFLCKTAGVPIHYCAETFSNDGTLPSLIMKALKRTMAGEYSRELGVKVLAGQKRIASLGFKMGGLPGYGLRRFLVSQDRQPKQNLGLRERKSISTDRVILVHGAEEEVQCVREIFRMLVSEKFTVYRIARELNRRGIRYLGHDWDYQSVHNILTHPKYMGCNRYCFTSRRLYTPGVKLPRSQWLLAPDAFEPIVDRQTFEEARFILDSRTINRSNDELLSDLRALLAEKGTLSLKILKESDSAPSPSTLRHRFGGLNQAYRLVGFYNARVDTNVTARQRAKLMRSKLVDLIMRIAPSGTAVLRKNRKVRERLCLADGSIVSMNVAHAFRVWKSTLRWLVNPNRNEAGLVAILARLDETNLTFMDFYVFRQLGKKRRYYLTRSDVRLKGGVKLESVATLFDVLNLTCLRRRGLPKNPACPETSTL